VSEDPRHEIDRLRARVAGLEADLLARRRAHDAASGGEATLPRAGVFAWCPTSGALAWSEEWYRMLGVDPAREPSMEALVARVHPADRGELARRVQGAVGGSGAGRLSFRVAGVEGLREVVGESIDLRPGDGQRFVVGVVFDMDAWREREAQRDAALEEVRRAAERLATAEMVAGMGSWEANPSTGEATWSDACFRLLGLDPETTRPGFETFLEAVHPDDRPLVIKGNTNVLNGGGPIRLVFRIRRPDRVVRWIAGHARAVEEDARGVQRLAGTLRDITEEHQLQAMLHQAQKMEAIARLAGGLAHDFNNYLTVIQGFASVLAERQPSPELDSIRYAAREATALTAQLLSLSRHGLMRPAEIDLRDALEGAARLIRPLAGDAIEVRLAIADDLAPVVLDPSLLQQVAINLAVNACDAMPRGGVLTLSARNADAPPGDSAGGMVCLCVTDDGIGMDSATRLRALEPFFTTKRPGHGTGLGLPTVFGIVSKAGGTLEIDSSPGSGTEVRVFLPRATRPVETAPGPRGATPPARGERVLVVEDDDNVRQLVTQILAQAGYRVAPAADGHSAIARWDEAEAAGEAFDLLVTDVSMPGLTGPALARALRGRRPSLDVLYITGFSAGETDLDGPVLAKPFSPDELRDAVRAVLPTSAHPGGCEEE